MLKYKLEDAIMAHIRHNYKECDLIIMHPKSWEKLTIEADKYNAFHILSHKEPLQYKGIRVLRSFDIEEDFFEIR